MVIATAACAAPPRVTPPSTVFIPSRTFVVRGDIPGGIVEFIVPPARGAGLPIDFPVTVRATGATTIEGPVSAEIRFTASKEDILIRLIPASDAPQVAVARGSAQSLVIKWDGRNDAGEIAKADEYVLLLRFRIIGGAFAEGATGFAFSVLR
ncbi:MAG: hypothetical protein NVS1B1_08310 [Candidatus Limnocylindrales bacterium]